MSVRARVPYICDCLWTYREAVLRASAVLKDRLVAVAWGCCPAHRRDRLS